MRYRTLAFSMILAAAWAAIPAGATTLVRMSLSQLTQASSTIIQGHVVSQQAHWNTAHTRILTVTTVQLDKSLKGRPPSTLLIEQPGGTVGNFHVRVPGTALLRPQAEYVFFLEPAGNTQAFHVVGMVQGAFQISQNGNGSVQRVILPLGALRTGSGMQTLSQSPSLGEFQATVTNVLRAPIVIPSGTALRVVIESTQFHGSGQVSVTARTTSDLFPNKAVVIPSGSQVQGIAQRAGQNWKIYWSSVSVRGSQAKIAGTNKVSQVQSLKGSSLEINVR